MALPSGIGGKGGVPSPQDAARKAAQDALQEAIAEQSGSGKPAAKEPPIRWQVPKMPGFMDVASAVGDAMHEATRFMNHRMQGEGVVVALQQPHAQSEGRWEAQVVEDGSSRVLQRYDGTDLLKLYAAHHAGRGVVVDGEV